MVIYLNKKVGMMIELNRLEDFGVDIKTIDLRIVIYLNSDFFIEVDDLELLQEIDEIYYYQNHFYGNVDYFLEEQFLSITEWGRFIYGDRVDDIKRKGKQIHLK